MHKIRKKTLKRTSLVKNKFKAPWLKIKRPTKNSIHNKTRETKN